MILVTGAAGKTGKAVVKALATRGATVRALVRRPENAVALEALGAAEVIIASFEDSAALARAAAGARAIYHICPNVSRDEEAFARTMVAAARAQGVARFVYHSVLHPQVEAMPHHWAKMRVEEMLFASGLAPTILQPAAYMQNILGGWRSIRDDGVFRVPYPVETRLSLVDLTDLADAAAVVLMNDGHAGATYEIAGHRAVEPSRSRGRHQRCFAPPRARRSGNGRRLGDARPRCRCRRARTLDACGHVPLLRAARPHRQSQHAALDPGPCTARPDGISQPCRTAGNVSGRRGEATKIDCASDSSRFKRRCASAV
jgi:uncharacterized protein YbjT (DUF2867 family)